MMFTDGVFISILMNTQALNRNFKVLNILYYIAWKTVLRSISWLLISDKLFYCFRLEDRAIKRGCLECISSCGSIVCSNPFLHHQSGVGQSPTEHQHLHLLHTREVRVPQVPRILQQPAILPRRHWFHRHGGLWEEMLAAESKGRNRIKFKLVFFRWTARPHMLK